MATYSYALPWAMAGHWMFLWLKSVLASTNESALSVLLHIMQLIFFVAMWTTVNFHIGQLLPVE